MCSFGCIIHRIYGKSIGIVDIAEDSLEHSHWVNYFIWGHVQLYGKVGCGKIGGVLVTHGCSGTEAPLMMGTDARAVAMVVEKRWDNSVGR